jgi:catechol 2,3-dioxygenase-like lactoylglutathione lyase family enzyme
MTVPIPPIVECEQQHPSLPVPSVPDAAAFYAERLGFAQGFIWGEPPSIAGVNLGRTQVFLEQGSPNPAGVALYFVVGNADELFAFHQAQGVEVVQPLTDQHYGLRDYRIRDLNGYLLGFGHHLFNAGPPIPIERVDVHVRLEKRLAALLQDLARHKRMSLTGCLEEILLHTCEPLGDGVASPHTAGDLRHIQALKVRHGIDYDSHASYRFVEEAPPG